MSLEFRRKILILGEKSLSLENFLSLDCLEFREIGEKKAWLMGQNTTSKLKKSGKIRVGIERLNCYYFR